MVDYNRDYYADLQLEGPTDDEKLINSQYRKLCTFEKKKKEPGFFLFFFTE